MLLVEAARQIIRTRYHPDRHAVGAALRTRSGRIHLGVHLECTLPAATVCAEVVAIGRAATEGDGSAIDTIVAVHQASGDDLEPRVVAPCGMCREMISDYAPDACVIVPGENSPVVMRIASLLPARYVR